MSRIPEFIQTLEIIKALHEKKNADYASEANPFQNFDDSQFWLDRFKNNRDKTFVWPVATKLSRLSQLLSRDEPALNESVEDSFDDIITYMILWKCDVQRRKNASTIIATEAKWIGPNSGVSSKESKT